MSRLFSKLVRPRTRGLYINIPLWLFASLMFAFSHHQWNLLGPAWIVLVVLNSVIWPFATIGRLADLRRSPLWVLPLSLSWIALVLALWWARHSHHSRIAGVMLLAPMALVLIVHLPLLLFPSRNLETCETLKPRFSNPMFGAKQLSRTVIRLPR